MQINKESECKIIKESIEKNQKDWIEHFNNKGEKMISAPDIYKVAKKGNKSIIESLKKDFEKSYEVTSTQIIYSKNNLKAEIIHDVDSKVAKPKKYKVEIPVLAGDFEENKETEKYLQALFDTKDSIYNILRVLKKFGKDKKLRLWTPNQSGRKEKLIRSVDLCFYGFDRFDVDGSYWFDDNSGLSRGVIVGSAEQKKKLGSKSK